MKLILSISILLTTLIAHGQYADWQAFTREVVISHEDSTTRANILIRPQTFKLDESLHYAWYNKGKINSNMGGYAGDLLQGDFLVFDKEKKLITQGMYVLGLKDGVWKYWYPNGNLRKVETWSQGRKHGIQKLFDIDGTLASQVDFKAGELVIEEEKKMKISKSKKDKAVSDTLQADIPQE